MTSMWSLMNPSGMTVTRSQPTAAKASIRSPTSGSSQGTCGGPLRLWKTSSQPSVSGWLQEARRLVGGRSKLGLVVASSSHGLRDRMGGEEHPMRGRVDGSWRGCLLEGEGGPNSIGDGPEEARMVVEQPQLDQFGGTLADGSTCPVEIVPILATARIGTERRGHEHERSPNAVVGHLLNRVHEIGGPVPVAPVDG